MDRVRIATRRSALALWQANHVAALLRAAHAGLEVSLVPITTEGDRIQDRPLALIGGKGLFIKELEVAIADGHADIAVHSMKDVPAQLPHGFTIGAVLERADPRDAFVSLHHARFADLPRCARVGTSSPRRECLLRAARPDLVTSSLRGNVDTRLGKLDRGDFDAIILAAAGLTRLGLEHRITEALEPALLLPAVGQGVVGIECRAGSAAHALMLPLEHRTTRDCLSAERAFSARLEGNCESPLAAYATLSGERLSLAGLVGAPDGSVVYRDSIAGPVQSATALGEQLAEMLLAAGAERLLATLRAARG